MPVAATTGNCSEGVSQQLSPSAENWQHMETAVEFMGLQKSMLSYWLGLSLRHCLGHAASSNVGSVQPPRKTLLPLIPVPLTDPGK